MAASAAASFVACYYLGLTRGAKFVFYQLAFRFWELAAGVLLFLLLPRVRALAARFGIGERLTGTAGLLLVMAALLVPRSSAYPYVRATIAVAGAMLLIGTAHASPRDWVRRALGSRLPVWIGARSYALYLWHWPVYVLARWTVGLTVWPFNAGAVVLSFALVATSYRTIEQPFRTSPWLKARPPSIRIGLCLLMMAGGWLAGRVLLEQQPSIGLGRVTREAADWYGDRQLLKTVLGTRRACEPTASAIDIGALKGAGTRYEPSRCPSQRDRGLFVIGDSHASAYLPMLEQLSAEEGRTVAVLPTPGCGYVDLLDAQDDVVDPHCNRVSRAAMDTVLQAAKPGDIVFLPSRRVPRLIELGGGRRAVPAAADGTAVDLYSRTDAELAGLARAVVDAPRWIEPLVSARLRVVLEAPKPVFRVHPFACVEWWNRTNPECAPGLDERRADLERYRAPVMDALTRLAATYAGVTVWDPMGELCSETTCSAMRDGRPLFFDSDHLSPYGNLVLLEPFRAMVGEIEEPDARARAEWSEIRTW